MAESDVSGGGSSWLEQRESAVRIRVRAQPRASRTELAGEHGGALKIRLAAPPVDGEANRELCRFIAKRLGVAPSLVRVVAGESGRDKTVEADGVDVAHVARVLGGGGGGKRERAG